MKKTSKKTKAEMTPQVAENAVDQDRTTAEMLISQYKVVVAAESAAFRERIKFGAMLALWERFLGESRGRGKGGDGLKGWLKEHCPEIKYTTAIKYKSFAKMAHAMLGGGEMAQAAILGRTEVVTPESKTVPVPAKMIDRCEKLFEDATSRRKLELMYCRTVQKMALDDAKRKAKKDDGEKLSDADAATVMWRDAMEIFELKRSAFCSSARDLNVNVAKKFLEELKMLVESLTERVNKG